MTAIKILGNKVSKYDVLYVNTPWSEIQSNGLDAGKLPLAQITADDAVLFVWTDTYSAAKTVDLIRAWGFEFHSVFKIMDLAVYPWMTGKSTVETARKMRAPQVFSPSWWSTPEGDFQNPTRPTTEQLWLATKGNPSKIFNTGVVPYSVVNLPEVGKKSRSKKGQEQKEGNTRPSEFLQSILNHINKDVRVLDLFSSTLHDDIDSWGPEIPGGFLTGFKKKLGLVGKINEALQSLKKKELGELCQKTNQDNDMSKSSAIVGLDVLESFKGPMVYELRNEKGEVQAWVPGLIRTLARKNLEDYSSKRKKRKMSPSSKDQDRPRHGIACASAISPELADFLKIPHDEKIARTTVVSRLNEYITDNKLQNPDHKVQVVLDEPLKKLLKPPEDFGIVTYFNLCKLVGKHFPKKNKMAKTTHV